MLKFQRTKLVNIIKNDDRTVSVHGVLDDHIYEIEIDMTIGIDDLTIRTIAGKWIRAENSECRRAIPFLKNAIGIRIDGDDFTQRINKHVGRKACPHFANLIIECCDAAEDAVNIIKFEDAKAVQPELTFEEYVAGNIPASKGKKPVARAVVREVDPVLNNAAQEKIKSVSGGFYVDLHIHTFPASQCSSATADEMIQEAKRIGLDAVCITDHNYVWDNTGIEALREKYDILILRGNEITTDQGDMLVFGMYKDIHGIIKLENLKKEVLKADGFMIVAHPFRGFLVFGAGQLGLTAEKARTRALFQFVDAIEVLNGKVTENENKLAAEVAAGLKLPATGGSDAHEVYEVGKYATRFVSSISNEKELLAALKSGDYDAVAFRKERTE